MANRLVSVRPIAQAILTAAAAFGGNGCTMQSDLLEVPASTSEISSPQAAEQSCMVVESWTDSSGTVTVTRYMSDWSNLAVHQGVTCAVSEDELAVGGEMVTDHFGNGPAPFMVASNPNETKRSWWCESESITGTPYKQRTLVLGLKLAGISGSALRQMAIIKEANAVPGHWSAGSASVDPGYVMVGGGASTSNARYLVGSYPDGIDEWAAISKDHNTPSVGRVRAYLIELPIHPAGFWANLGVLRRSDAGDWVASARSTDLVPAPQSEGWALTTVGGYASYSGPGRMLESLSVWYPPFQHRAVSSDAFYPDSGITYSSSLSIRAQ